MPAVYNKRTGSPGGSVYVGRPTCWGNPFSEGVDGTREEVIEAYRAWLLARPSLVAKAKHILRGRDLVCWCAPKACHADILLEIANS
jgi:hypothetical protein